MGHGSGGGPPLRRRLGDDRVEVVMDFRTLIFTGSQTIIGISGLLILAGLFFIKTGRKDLHKKAMISASIFAFIFVILYLIRTAIFPHTKYAGPYRAFYLWIVLSHTLLAIVNGPMALYTLYLAFKERFDRHKRIAPYTAGIWIYVAATGWIIFAFQK